MSSSDWEVVYYCKIPIFPPLDLRISVSKKFGQLSKETELSCKSLVFLIAVAVKHTMHLYDFTVLVI